MRNIKEIIKKPCVDNYLHIFSALLYYRGPSIALRFLVDNANALYFEQTRRRAASGMVYGKACLAKKEKMSS